METVGGPPVRLICSAVSVLPTALLRFLKPLTARRQATLLAISVALLLAACGGGGAPESSGFPVTIQRPDGKQLTFVRRPERIVSLSPGHTEVLFAIGAGDQIVAVDSESDFPADAQRKAKLDATDLNAKAIIDFNPDLLVIMDGPQELVRFLDDRGLQVLALETPEEFADLLNHIDLLGQVTGHVPQSDALVDSIDKRVLAMLDKTAAVSGPRVYHELDDQLTSISDTTFTGELYLILNAQNIVGRSEEPRPRLTLDSIVQADPEVIIVAHSGATPESVEARSGWEAISAIKNDRVYAVDPDIVNRPGPRLVDGLETLAKLLYPDLFP